MADFQPPPTYALPILVDERNPRDSQFNPIWLKWFLELTQMLTDLNGSIFTTQSANTVFAGPATGAAALPAFRALVAADLPGTIVQATATLTDNAIVRGDGGSRNIQTSTVFIDDSGRLITGSGTAQAMLAISGAAEVLGTTPDTATASIGKWSADAIGANLIFGKARGAAVGTNTIVQSGDNVGGIYFAGANGTNLSTAAAAILGTIDGTPGASNDMPGRLEFYTTADGSGTVTLRATIKNTGTLLLGTATETSSAGRLQLGSTSDTTAAGGICLGTDVQAFRAAANLLAVPDMLSARATAGTPYTDTTLAASLFATAGNIACLLTDSARSANDRKVEWVWGGGNIDLRFTNDAYNAATNIIRATGGQATGVTLFTVPTAVSSVFGHTASITVANAGKMQIVGTTAASSQLQQSHHSADSVGPNLALGKSRNASAGGNTIVQSGDSLGTITAYGADGTNYDPAAQLAFAVDGTPGAGTDMPGRILALTSPDGTATLTEAWRVDSAQKHIFQVDRAVRFNNQTSAVGVAAGTLLNAPTAGDPGYWLKINIDGTNYAVPAWAG